MAAACDNRKGAVRLSAVARAEISAVAAALLPVPEPERIAQVVALLVGAVTGFPF